MADKRTGFDQLPTNVMRNEQLLTLVRQMQEMAPDSAREPAPLYENAPTAVYRAIDRRRAREERLHAQAEEQRPQLEPLPPEPTPAQGAAVALASEPSQAPAVVTTPTLPQPPKPTAARVVPRRASGRAALALLLGLLAASGLGYAGWRVHARIAADDAAARPALAPGAHAPAPRR